MSKRSYVVQAIGESLEDYISIAGEDRSLDIQRFVSPPIDTLDVVADARAAVTNGNLGRTDGLWQRLLNPYDGPGTTTYVLGDIDAPEGYAILRPGLIDGGVPQPLVSTDVAANTPRALRRLMTFQSDEANQIRLASKIFAGPVPWVPELY
jgi:predicted acetyltransferase